MSVEAHIYCELIKCLFLICISMETSHRVRVKGKKKKKNINLDVKGVGT